MKRRTFVQWMAAAPAVAALGCATQPRIEEPWVMTVRGRLAAREMGVTLTHEHALANFQSHEEWTRSPAKYDLDEVVTHVLPHLRRIAELGCRTFVDATAVGLGRDASLLRRLSDASGLHILTTTGNYAAFDEKFVPPHVREDDVDALAARWIRDFKEGIDGTGIRPGFIKLGFNGDSLREVERKLITAAAVAHRATGLTIGSHTGLAKSAYEQLEVLEAAGVQASAWIWIHAHNEPDPRQYLDAARSGAWISLDGVGPESIDTHADRVIGLRDAGLLHRVLISQDAGWYWVGEPGGGKFRPYDTVFTQFLPELRRRGVSESEIRQLLEVNPAAAFAVRVRTG